MKFGFVASVIGFAASASLADPCCVGQMCSDRTPAYCATASGILGHCRVGQPCGAPGCDLPAILPVADLQAVKGGSDLWLTWSPDPSAELYDGHSVTDKRDIPTCATTGTPVVGSAPTTIAEAVDRDALLPSPDGLTFYCVAGGCPAATGACCSLGLCEDGKTVASCLGAYLGDGSSCPDPACPVADVMPCLVGGNVLYFDGDPGDPIHPGVDTITAAMWSAVSFGVPTTDIELTVLPSLPSQGGFWRVAMTTQRIPGPLVVGIYENAVRIAFEGPGQPGLNVTGNRTCASLTGRYQVHEIVTVGIEVLSYTASWIQYCEGRSAALRGCIHYEQ